MPQQNLPDTVTIPLADLLHIIIGDEHSGSPCNIIPSHTALILQHILKDNLVYKVDTSDPANPKLWWYKEWREANHVRQRQKEYSEKCRVERWLLEANIKDLTKAIIKHTPIPEDCATAMAYNMIKNPNGMIVIREFFGIQKLKTTLEELQ